MPLDADACYRALVARDARFDGVFFVGVRTTGIYCRPVCRARTPGRARCVFFQRPAEAERDGFRACFRCRPERAPGAGRDEGVSRTVAAAVRRIEAGALNDGGVEPLADELGVTARHLRRCVQAELGVSPLALALTRRLALARELLHGTTLPITDVAYASGFQSLRRFNDAFVRSHGHAPRELRTRPRPGPPGGPLRLTLGYRPPLAWASLLAFLGARTVTGVDAVTERAYLRAVRAGGADGWLRVTHDGADALTLEVSPSLVPALLAVVDGVRRLFDLDAHPAAVDAHLGRDPRLAPLVKRRPGLRVPGAFSPFETTVAAVLGQQVTVRAGVTLASRLVRALGEPVVTPHAELYRLWPTAARLASVRAEALAELGMPAGRARTVVGVAAAVAEGRLRLDRGVDPEALKAQLLAIPGVGPWTAAYVAMRATSWPDAFPEKDAALARALGLAARDVRPLVAEPWSPWRSYATMHLWTALSTPGRGDAP